MMMVFIAHASWIDAGMFGFAIPNWFAYSGVMGVEVFFVLSGFLIGSILLRIASTGPGWRDWLTFMVRRWMRTLPAYYVVLLLMVLLWPPDHFLIGHVSRYATLTQNLVASFPEDDWFNVSWSLSIEEWFYLLFSVAVVASAMLSSGKAARDVPLVVFLVLPVFFRILYGADDGWFHSVHQVVAYRLDAIAYGVALARLGGLANAARWWPLFLVTGVSLVLVGWATASANVFHLPIFYVHNLFTPVTSTGVAFCIVAAVRWKSAGGPIAGLVRMLSNQSYVIYLTHMTLIQLVVLGYWRGQVSRGLAVAAAPVLAFCVSWVSYRFLETPILSRRPPQRAGLVDPATNA